MLSEIKSNRTAPRAYDQIKRKSFEDALLNVRANPSIKGDDENKPSKTHYSVGDMSWTNESVDMNGSSKTTTYGFDLNRIA